MKKEKKRFLVATGLLLGIGVLSIVYASLTSTLHIQGDNSSVSVGGVEFVQANSYPYCVGTDYVPEGSPHTGAYMYNNYELHRDPSSTVVSPSYALANAGTVTIGRNTSSPDSRPNDTAVISGTELFDYGSYVIYQLNVKNTSTVPVKLSSYSPEALNESITALDGSESTTEFIRNNVGVTIYGDYPTSDNNMLAPYNGGGSTTEDRANYLTAGGQTNWYVKVFHKSPHSGSSSGVQPELRNSMFSFSVSPIWETALG